MIEAVKTPTPEEQDARMSEVISLVMHRNGLRLSKDDPLLIIHTLQEFLVQRLATQQDELIRTFCDELTKHIEYTKQDWCNHAAKEANKMLLKASNASTELFQVRLKEATDEMVSRLQKINKDALAQLEAKTESNKAFFQKNLYYLFGATAFNILAVILVLIAIL